MATVEQLEVRLTKNYEQRMKLAEEAKEINEELDRLHNSKVIEQMSPQLKRQVLEAAGVESSEAFGTPSA